MISKETFEAVCNNAKIHLEYGGKDYNEIVSFLDMLSQIEDIPVDESTVELLNLELVNTYREDVTRPSLTRDELLSMSPSKEAGCISVPVSLREEI